MTAAAAAYARVLDARTHQAQQVQQAHHTQAEHPNGSTHYHSAGFSPRAHGGLVCPHCSERAGRPVVRGFGDFTALRVVPAYPTPPVYRCRWCRFTFAAPYPDAIHG